MSPLHNTDTNSPLGSSQNTPNGGGGTPSDPTASNNNLTAIDPRKSPGKQANNTVSAAADSSDNQPATPQPNLLGISPTNHLIYSNHHQIYSNQPNSATTSTSNTTNANQPSLNQLYTHHSYSSAAHMELQQHQQQQQQQQHHTPAQQSAYSAGISTYDQYNYRNSMQNSQQMDYINSNTMMLFGANPPVGQQQSRFHPYLQQPSSGGLPALSSQNSNNMDTSAPSTAIVSAAASSSRVSPRVVSSTSPSSSSNQMQMGCSTSSISSMSAGNPISPNTAGSSPQCKKCGLMCANESELQEHITNVHGTSPYGSSGYASSPYVKEELQQRTSPAQNQPPQPIIPVTQHQPAVQSHILDLDSKLLLNTPAVGSISSMVQGNLTSNPDPLHGLQHMQQRAGLNSWDQQPASGESLTTTYMQQQQAKQSPYDVSSNSCSITKTEYPTTIKTEYSGNNQQQVLQNKSFDPALTTHQQQQQQQMIPPALSSSPAEFPSTTTPQEQPQQNVANNQQFRGANFEPPSSSSANIPSGNLGTKAANWKSNEARRPKTYLCRSCNKWFTSSGHLKRHYNTTLHKNAVKSSGEPDPVHSPISKHHYPNRNATVKTGRGRGSSRSAAQNQPQQPHPVQPPEPPNSPQNYGGGSQASTVGLSSLADYSAHSSPNSTYSQDQQYQYMAQVPTTAHSDPIPLSVMEQSPQQQSVSNGHPNALAGPSVSIIQDYQMPSSSMRGLLNTLTTMPTSTATTTVHITKIEHLEGATLVNLQPVAAQEQQQPAAVVNQEYLGQMQPANQEVEDCQALLSTQTLQAAERHHCNNTAYQQAQYFQLEAAPLQEDMECQYPNTLANSSVLITSHQQCQEPQQQEHQMVAQAIYTLLEQPNTTALESPNMLSAMATPLQHNNMLQQSLITTEQQQLPPATTIRTTNMANLHQLSQHLTQQQLQPLTELQPQPNMQQQPGTTSTSTPFHITPTHINNTTSIQSFPIIQQQVSVLHQQDPTWNTLPTTTGNTDHISSYYFNPTNLTPFDDIEDTVDITCLHLVTPMPTISPTSSQCSNGSVSSAYAGQTDAFREREERRQRDEYELEQNRPSGSKRLCCGECNISFSTQSDLTQHRSAFHNGTNPYLFGIDSPTQGDLPPQVLVNQGDSRIQTAEQPDSPVSAPREIAERRQDRPSLNTRFPCPKCNGTFAKQCYLTQHMNTKHNGTYPHRCKTCGKRFKIIEKLVEHKKAHTDLENCFKCENCNKHYRHKGDLNRHIHVDHKDGKKLNKCKICGNSFSRNDQLYKHYKSHIRQWVASQKPANGSKAKKYKKFSRAQENIPPGAKLLSEKQLIELLDHSIATAQNFLDVIAELQQ